MKTLCYIPAKGVSRGVPRKNLMPLGSMPLVMHTVQAALEYARGRDSLVVVSTESDEVAAIVRGSGALVRARPPHLSSDEATITEVVENDVPWISEQLGEDDVLIVLQATSPFRTAEDIQGATEHLNAHQWAQSLSSVSKYLAPVHQALALDNEDRISYLFDMDNLNIRSQRQSHQEYWHSNGAISMVRWGWFCLNRRFFDTRLTVGYPTSQLCGFDIDNPAGLGIARLIVRSLEVQEAVK